MNLTGKKTVLFMAVLLLISFFTGCSGKGKDEQKEVYEDMKKALEESQLMSANIGIFSKTVTADSVSYGECGSGVIIDKRDGMYYAFTAAHVVSVENAQLLVFTVNTEMKSETLPGTEIEALMQDTYESMINAETVFVSDRNDLAVIRFACDEELAVMELADKDPAKDDRIMCIGNPQSDWFAISYGKVTSGIEKFREGEQFSSNAMKHTAYINVGSSGGAAVNEDMKLVGITPAAYISPKDDVFMYGLMIPVSEISLSLQQLSR